MKPEPIALSWSGGKDCTFALHQLRANNLYDVRALLTTVTREYDRISIHGVRRALLEKQAQSLGIPLEIAFIPPACSNDEYERNFGETLRQCQSQGMTTLAAGDLFLEDVRAYREAFASRHGLKSLFPLWKRDTAQTARDFIHAGFKAVITCVDTHVLGAEFAGRDFDYELLRDLPQGVDPCGENGEFHTFVWAGPGFSFPVYVVRGETTLQQERFQFCDFLPNDENS